jgi:hypothetical protein
MSGKAVNAPVVCHEMDWTRLTDWNKGCDKNGIVRALCDQWGAECVPVARLSVDGVCARPGGRLRRAPTDYRLSISSPKFRGACVDESGILLLTLTMSSSRVLGSGAQRPRGGGNQPPATRRRRRRVVGTARGNPPTQARHALCLHRGRPSPKGCRSGSSSGDPPQ